MDDVTRQGGGRVEIEKRFGTETDPLSSDVRREEPTAGETQGTYSVVLTKFFRFGSKKVVPLFLCVVKVPTRAHFCGIRRTYQPGTLVLHVVYPEVSTSVRQKVKETQMVTL